MRWSGIIDEEEVKKTINILKPNHQLFEVRILGTDKRKVLSGYFTDADVLIKAFDSVDLRGQNVYITLNDVNEALYSRIQHDKFVANTNTTSDTEIDAYRWLFIDFDPCRPTNISSSESELRIAEDLKAKVKEYLANVGFAEPIEALSGNGYHLLYRIYMPNTDENAKLVNAVLTALSSKFDTKEVKVDTTNSNPSRICKLHGTLAQKGASTEKRPHRMSKILNAPDVVEITSKEKLMLLVEDMPVPEQKKPNRPTIQPAQQFDLLDFMNRNGMTYKEDFGRDCKMFLLDECPFDHNHRSGDAKIFAYTNGAIAFKCHHNSCKGKIWQDVRELFEPDAYLRKDSEARIEAGYQEHKKLKEEAFDIPLGDYEPKPKKEKAKRKLKTATGLLAKNLPEPRVIVGVDSELPMLVEGTCVLSAKPKVGKSWLALAMCVAVANGDDFLGYKTCQCSTLYLDLETSEQLQQKRLKKVLNGAGAPNNFYLETETDNLDDGFIEQIESYIEQDPNIGLIVVDVFQIIRSEVDAKAKENEYAHVYRDLTPLNNLAQKYHMAIVLVCHDRKMVDPEDPFSNILGSTGLQGAATQMIVMFKRRKDDPIHISIKGKTIDGLPDLDVKLDKGQWQVVAAVDADDRRRSEDEEEYKNSIIREAILKVAEGGAEWKGRCSQLINEAVNLGIPLTNTPVEVGGFINRHQGRFLKNDLIRVLIINNGTGPKIYKIYRTTIDAIDEKTMGYWENALNIDYF